MTSVMGYVGPYTSLKLHAFMRHLRSIKKVTWKDKVTNKVILERADLPSMQDLLIRKTLRWTGHIIRMPSERLPEQIPFSQLPAGERKIGRPRLRYKDTIKRNLIQREINIKTWTTLAIQRADWRSAVKWHCEDGHCRSATDSNEIHHWGYTRAGLDKGVVWGQGWIRGWYEGRVG